METLFNASILFIIIGGIIAALGTAGTIYYGKKISQKNEQNAKKTSALIGELLTKKLDINRDVDFIIGTNMITVESDKFLRGYKYKPMKMPFGNEYLFEIWQEKKEFKINATIVSIDKKVVAQIVKNEWEINPNNYFSRNYDSCGLEIIDEFGFPILQIDILQTNKMFIGGIFFNKNNFMIYNINDCVSLVGEYSVNEVKDLSKNLKRIFLYPANNNLGKRDSSSTLILKNLLFYFDKRKNE